MDEVSNVDGNIFQGVLHKFPVAIFVFFVQPPMLQNTIHEALELCRYIFDAHWQNLPFQRTKRCGHGCEIPVIWMQRIW